MALKVVCIKPTEVILKDCCPELLDPRFKPGLWVLYEDKQKKFCSLAVDIEKKKLIVCSIGFEVVELMRFVRLSI